MSRPNGDTVVRADWVVTVDDADRVIKDGAVAFANGLLTAVGPADEVLSANRHAAVVHLSGHALLPGLVNAHTHLAMAMFRGYADDRDLQGFLDVVLPAEQRLLTAARVRSATRAAALECILGGTTTALDMYFFTDAMLAGAADVGLRLQTGPMILDGPGPESWEWDERLARAERWLTDNPVRPGFRPVLQPHSTYAVSPEHLCAVAELAERHDAAVHVHASENAAELDLVASLHGRRPVRVLEDCGLLRPGTVLAHAVWLDDDEVVRVARSGSTVAHCPASNLKLASGVARIPELRSAGATVGIGTDGPASSNDLDVLAAARLCALLHKGAAPSSGGESGGAAALPAAAVLRMATADSASAVGLGDQIGSLCVGRRADLIAVDLDQPHTQPVYDPISAIVYAAGRRDVRRVWIDGQPVVEDGRPVRVDPATVVRELRELHADVLAAPVGPAAPKKVQARRSETPNRSHST